MARLVVLTLLLLCLAIPALAQPVQLTDPFTDQAKFQEAWETDFGWQIRQEALFSEANNRQFAVPVDAPWGKRVSVEAVITPRKPLGTDWKLAAVAIYHDAQNYWAIGLCEHPDSTGKSHSIDIGESRQGQWPANWDDKLAPLPDTPFPPFQWQYDHPYRVRLEMTPESVIGTIAELDGKLLHRIGFALKSPAVMDGKPALMNQFSRSEYREFKATIDQQVPAPAPQKAAAIPPFAGKGIDMVRGNKTGFFHVEEQGSTWWLIDPAGQGTFFLATDHVNYNAHWCQVLGYAPYHRNVEKKYGSESAWAKSTIDRLQSWGFNGLGAGGTESVQHKGLSHAGFLNLGGDFCEFGPEYRITYPANGHAVPCSYFPNVFHPRFAEFCQKQAKKLVTPNATDPWLIGYFIDNELAWWGKTWGDTEGLFDDTFRKPADHTAKIALIDWLKARYPAADTLAKAWGTQLASYDELLTRDALTGTNADRVGQDKRAFAEFIADRYFAITTKAIRDADPNHMILGCRFAGITNQSYTNAWAAAGKYCDIISVNIYEKVDLETGEVYSTDLGKRVPVEEILTDVNHRAGNKPMMVTEWSYLAYDSGLPCTGGAGQRVNTQTERAFCFEQFQKLILSRPYMIGSSFFMWADEPAEGIAPWFPEDGNYGLVDVNDKPYAELTSTATRVHAAAYSLHTGKTPEFRVSQGTKPGQFLVQNRGRSAGDCIVTLSNNGKSTDTRLHLAPDANQSIQVDGQAGPSGRLLVCSVRPAEGNIEMDPGDNTARQLQPASEVKLPPLAALQKAITLVVANPTSSELPAGPVILKLSDLPPGIDAKTDRSRLRAIDAATGSPVAVQLDDLPGGAELALAIPRLSAASSATLIIGISAQPVSPSAAVACRMQGKALDITNGRLKLTRTGESVNLFDRIDLDGQQIGDFTAVIQQQIPQNAWVHAAAMEKVEVYSGPVRLVADFTFAAPGDNAWRSQWRITLLPNATSFGVESLWIENTSARAWKLAAYYLYATSKMAGQDTDDLPRGLIWNDAANKLSYGIIDPAGSFVGNFWKEPETGIEHPDALRKLDTDLAPGQRFSTPQPQVFVTATKGDFPKSWLDQEQAIKNQSRLLWKAGKAQ